MRARVNQYAVSKFYYKLVFLFFSRKNTHSFTNILHIAIKLISKTFKIIGEKKTHISHDGAECVLSIMRAKRFFILSLTH